MLTAKRKSLLLTAFTVLLSLGWAGCRGFFVNATLTSITLSPANGAVVVGNTLQLTAQGTYNDGSTKSNINGSVTWTSSNNAVATVSSGLVKAVSGSGSTPPSVTITAASGSATSGTATVTVFPGTLTLITIAANGSTTISPGSTLQFTATGTFSGGTSATITDLVTWSSDNTGFVTVNSNGLASGVVTGGSANISASMTLNGSTTTSNSVLVTVQ